MSDLMNLDFEGNEVRVIMREGEPWWVVSDVCRALGIKDVSDAAARLPLDDRAQTPIVDAAGRQNPNTWIANEAGLYELVFRSTRPAASAFRRWVMREVLPQIRKTDAYHAYEMSPDLQRIYDLVMVQARQEVQIRRTQRELAATATRVAGVEERVAGVEERVDDVEGRVLDLETTSALSETADLLTLRDLAHACGTGQNRMKSWLMAHGIMFRDHNNADRVKQHPWVEENLATDFWEKWANGQGWSWVPYFSARGVARIKRMYENTVR